MILYNFSVATYHSKFIGETIIPHSITVTCSCELQNTGVVAGRLETIHAYPVNTHTHYIEIPSMVEYPLDA